jgi:hypothetical protein
MITFSDKTFSRTCESELFYVGLSGKSIDGVVGKEINFQKSRTDSISNVILR